MFTEPQSKQNVMRSKLLKLTMALLLITAAPSKAQEIEEAKKAKLERIMDAIIKTESQGNPKAHNRKGNCAGILQITPIFVKEANSILKKRGIKKRYTLADRFNVEKSKEMFFIIQEYFNPSANTEKAIRLWNGGPYYKKAKTQKYYNKVKRNMKKAEN